jgi:hypothetical protein
MVTRSNRSSRAPTMPPPTDIEDLNLSCSAGADDIDDQDEDELAIIQCHGHKRAHSAISLISPDDEEDFIPVVKGKSKVQ